MGNYRITIEGTGVHHNEDLPQDADRLARGLVQSLVDGGHKVTDAVFSWGDRSEELAYDALVPEVVFTVDGQEFKSSRYWETAVQIRARVNKDSHYVLLRKNGANNGYGTPIEDDLDPVMIRSGDEFATHPKGCYSNPQMHLESD